MNTEQQQGREQSMLEDIRKSGRTKIIETRPRRLPGRGDQGAGRARGPLGAENLARLRQEIAKVRGS